MKLVVLTGAGISAESGLKTFRGNDGMWEHERIEDVCTPKGFRSDRMRVKNFYSSLRLSLKNFKPNAAHIALTELEATLKDDFLLITQNVDDLHERAGSKRILHMHGALKKLRCEQNQTHVFDFDGNETDLTRCPICNRTTRPHIVFFEEVPLYMDTIQEALRTCKDFVYIGTSSIVYPAAGFKSYAHSYSAHVTCLNLEVPKNDPYTDESIEGYATEIVPAWCKRYLSKII